MDAFDRDNRPSFAPAARPAAPAWMITFVDLLSLLLGFFVLMFAMAAPRQDAFWAMADSLSAELNAKSERGKGGAWHGLGAGTLSPLGGHDLEYLRAVLAEKFAADPLLRQARIVAWGDRLIIALPSELLFTLGSAKITNDARSAARALAGALYHIDNRIEIEGHADPQLLDAGSFPSVWEISLARASALADELAVGGYNRKISVFGLGASQFDQVSGSTEADRRRAARRVDLVIREGRATLRSGGWRE